MSRLRDNSEGEMLNNFRKTHIKRTINYMEQQIEYFIGGNGPLTILLFHGAISDAESSYRRMPLFEKDYKVITPTISLFSSPDELSDAVNEILKIEKCKNLVIYGGSYGGLAAQAFFHRNYQNIKAMIISVSFPPDLKWVKYFKLMTYLLRLLPEDKAKNLVTKRLFKLSDYDDTLPNSIKERIDFYMDYFKDMVENRIKKKHIIATTKFTGEFCKDIYKKELYAGWKGKILVITSKNDANFQYHEKLKNQYPNVEEIVYEEGGHLISIVREDDMMEKIIQFIGKLEY